MFVEFDNNFAERLFLGNSLTIFKKPNRCSTREWAEENRFLTSDVSSRQGKMNCMETPWMLYVMECLDNPEIPIIIGKKSAQIAWTETINSYIGRTIDLDPRNIMIAFPRAASVLKFYKEKLKPLIIHTPVVKEKITENLTRISHKHIPFQGGFLVLANIGAADDGKSSVIPIIIVEEPDGVKKDVNNQGDGMAILKQRMKSFSDGKLIYAGTPTDKDFSQVDRAYEQSNKMLYMVPCYKCKQFHSLSFTNLRCDFFQNRKIDEIYGVYNPETAYYTCPYCQAYWDDGDKKKAVIEALNYHNLGWKAERPEIKDIYGFAFNELLSSFEASKLSRLAEQKLKAEVAYENGHEGLMKAFVNNNMGEAYVPLTDSITIEELKSKRLNYPERIVPYEGLILTAGVDVQHNRFAIVIRAWGRNGNSHLVLWEEIFGDVLDPDDVVWTKLEELLFHEWPHATGNKRTLHIEALSIDSADGTTTELVYRWVLLMNMKYMQKHNTETQPIFAVRGVGELKFNNYEIFNEPGQMEIGTNPQARRTLAETMGVNVFPLGAYRAHEEILRRINLKGNRDRYYHCETSYGGYEEQILSCRKTYGTDSIKAGYKLISGKHKEALDCEKMALHAAYAIQVRNYTNSHWAAREQYIYMQGETNAKNIN